jgi:type IV pilus assembly protein PilB
MAKAKQQATSSEEHTFLAYLVAKGVIPEDRAARVREESERIGRPPEALIAESGILSEEDVYRLRAEFLGMPYRALPPDEKIPPELFKMIPEEAARRYQFVPLGREGSLLDVGMCAPESSEAQDALRFLAMHEGVQVRKFLIAPTTFQAILNQYRPFQGEVKEALSELEAMFQEEGKEKPEERPERAVTVTEAPIIKMVAVMLRQAVEGNASDIHIEPGMTQMRVRFRVDGILYTSLFLPMTVHAAIVARLKILSSLKIDETRLAQDGRFRSTIEGRQLDFRVATLPTAWGEKVTIRILDPTISLRTFEELGLKGQAQRAISEAVKRPFGVIFISGPTGSGKTTTLYAMLQGLNRDEVNIVTLEDPIEYFIDGVNQSQTNEEIGYTFGVGLRHILRGDPNVIMVGEVRDSETAKLAIHAGLTGHLVLSTIHTNNAVGIIPRLIDLGVDAFLISPTLLIGVAQRLVQRLCPDCRVPRDPYPAEMQLIEEALRTLPEGERSRIPSNRKLYEAPGCDQCRGKGTRGRIAVFEVLRMTPDLRRAIASGASEILIREEAVRQGMVTMFQDGILKVLEGTIALEELLRVVEEKEEVVG